MFLPSIIELNSIQSCLVVGYILCSPRIDFVNALLSFILESYIIRQHSLKIEVHMDCWIRESYGCKRKAGAQGCSFHIKQQFRQYFPNTLTINTLV